MSMLMQSNGIPRRAFHFLHPYVHTYIENVIVDSKKTAADALACCVVVAGYYMHWRLAAKDR
jgi:hypothetical protein